MSPSLPSFRTAAQFWLKLGLISFGGPSGQIAILHAELVQKRKWIDEERFLHALNFCMLLPGPEATQLATFCGWYLHGTAGGLVAGTLFILPAAILLWLLSLIYVVYGHVAWLTAAFQGVKPVVIALVISALWRIGRHTLKSFPRVAVAAFSFGALFFLHAPFPWVLGLAAAVGVFQRPRRDLPAPLTSASPASRFSWKHPVLVLGAGLVLWWFPVVLAGVWLGWNSTLVQQGLFFSKAALVTFGGAYAVLPYVGQQAVAHYGWLGTAQMLDGLGLAETTPGPLIMVLQFVGFLGGWQHPGQLPPLLAATACAAVTTWVTFVPSFLFIFLGAPHLEQLRHKTWLTGPLDMVTAAIVGVILNLAVWFSLQVVLRPSGPVNWFSVAVAAAALAALQGLKASVVLVVLAGAGLGLLQLAF